MNHLSFFSSLEKDKERADVREGDAIWIQGATLSIRPKTCADDAFVMIGGLIDPIRGRNKEFGNQNIFCMYALDGELQKTGIDARLFEFGETFVLITQGDEFLNRIARAADKLGQQVLADRVNYVGEKTHHGYVGPFTKSDAYSHQVEFRIVLNPGMGHPISLEIGDIRDIAVTGKSMDLPQRLGFDPTTGQLMVSN